MVPRDKILELETRKIIYNTILNKPGLHLRELARNVKIPLSTMRYHLNFLQKNELVDITLDNGLNRYYAKRKIGRKEKKIINLLRQETIIKILVVFLLNEDKKIFYKKDLGHLPRGWYDPWNYIVFKHRTTIESYLKKLDEAGLIKVIRVGRKKGYTLIDSEKLWAFLIEYNNQIDSKKITVMLNWANNFIVPHQLDFFIECLWDVFPHPYYG